MKTKQEFMMIFRFAPNFDHQPSQQEQLQMQQDWGAFIGKIALEEKIVSTTQLGFEGNQIASDLTLTEGIHSNEGQMVSGNMLVLAYSLKEATELAKKCPIIQMGGSVEVRSTIKMN